VILPKSIHKKALEEGLCYRRIIDAETGFAGLLFARPEELLETFPDPEDITLWVCPEDSTVERIKKKRKSSQE